MASAYRGSVGWLAFSIFAGCVMNEQASAPLTPYNTYSVRTLDELPPCTNARESQLYYVETTQTFHACVQSEWHAIDVRGIPGVTGSSGPAGDTGATGIAGNTGPVGATGAEGATGDTGPSGPQGQSGTSGLEGATGASGSIGQPGATGALGATGASGPIGATGSVGPSGASGPTGATGSVGLSGATGVTGATGPIGASGASGATGAVGASGVSGATGLMGPTGSKGDDGATGATGPTGPPGYSLTFYGNWSDAVGADSFLGSATSRFPFSAIGQTFTARYRAQIFHSVTGTPTLPITPGDLDVDLEWVFEAPSGMGQALVTSNSFNLAFDGAGSQVRSGVLTGTIPQPTYAGGHELTSELWIRMRVSAVHALSIAPDVKLYLVVHVTSP